MEQLLTLFPQVNFDSSMVKILTPLLILTAGGTLNLILSASKKLKGLNFPFAALILCLSIFFSVSNFSGGVTSLSGGILYFDFYSSILSIMLLGFTLLALFLFSAQASKEFVPEEIYPLTLFSVAGAILLVTTQHLLFMFIALEIMSLAVYVMVAIRRESRFGAEAAMKYFVLGGLASALFLYGSSLIFGVSGSFVLSKIVSVPLGSPLFLMGSLLVLTGVLFKAGAFPFHTWIPDVYQGAMLSVTGYMGTVIKLAAFGILLRFSPLFLKVPFLFEILSVVAILTMLIGNFAALVQKDMKRLLAYSSISHTGYLLVGVLAVLKDPAHLSAVIIYLILYGFSNLGAFAALAELGSDKGEKDVTLLSLEGVAASKPLLAGSLSFFLLGMAGIPLTSGFIGKYLIFSSAVSSGLVPIVVVAILTSLVSVYYYFKIIVAMFMKETTEPHLGMSLGFGTVMVAFVGVVVILSMGIFPQPIMQFFSENALKIY
jgi:NADH-quinone oxidoreductase subunit N